MTQMLEEKNFNVTIHTQNIQQTFPFRIFQTLSTFINTLHGMNKLLQNKRRTPS